MRLSEHGKHTGCEGYLCLNPDTLQCRVFKWCVNTVSVSRNVAVAFTFCSSGSAWTEKSSHMELLKRGCRGPAPFVDFLTHAEPREIGCGDLVAALQSAVIPAEGRRSLSLRRSSRHFLMFVLSCPL